MQRQRNNSQINEQDKSPERTNNERDLAGLLDLEFKKEIIKMLTNLRKIVNRNADHCNRELETIKMNQSKIQNSIAEIKINLETMTSRLNGTEE